MTGKAHEPPMGRRAAGAQAGWGPGTCQARPQATWGCGSASRGPKLTWCSPEAPALWPWVCKFSPEFSCHLVQNASDPGCPLPNPQAAN